MDGRKILENLYKNIIWNLELIRSKQELRTRHVRRFFFKCNRITRHRQRQMGRRVFQYLVFTLQILLLLLFMSAPPANGIHCRSVDPTLSQYFSRPNHAEGCVVIGFGSLLSETSARSTFPTLSNFRPVRVEGYRRVFTHPTAIFFERGIADLSSKRMASLSIEKAPGHSFCGCAFVIDSNEDPESLLEREEEFGFEIVKFSSLLEANSDGGEEGIICTSSRDEIYYQRWGEERFKTRYGPHGITSIWDDWNVPGSGILPCSVYLRHVYLAAQKAGEHMLDSLLDETYLVDRTTTIRQYLNENPQVLEELPPQNLIGRYSG